MSTIYIVYEAVGDRYEYIERPVKAFSTQDSAEKYREYKEATARKRSERFTKIVERLESWRDTKVEKASCKEERAYFGKTWNALESKLYERYPIECCEWEDEHTFRVGELELEGEA